MTADKDREPTAAAFTRIISVIEVVSSSLPNPLHHAGTAGDPQHDRFAGERVQRRAQYPSGDKDRIHMRQQRFIVSPGLSRFRVGP